LEIFGDPLKRLWNNCIFTFCSVPEFHRQMFSVVVTSSEEMRAEWLKKVEELVEQYFPTEQSVKYANSPERRAGLRHLSLPVDMN
jgi:NAD(P)H dehydrogenase (quinone)